MENDDKYLRRYDDMRRIGERRLLIAMAVFYGLFVLACVFL